MWPKQVLFVWEFKDPKPTPELISTRLNFLQELPDYDHLYYTPDRCYPLINDLPTEEDKKLVRTALTNAKWVECTNIGMPKRVQVYTHHILMHA